MKLEVQPIDEDKPGLGQHVSDFGIRRARPEERCPAAERGWWLRVMRKGIFCRVLVLENSTDVIVLYGMRQVSLRSGSGLSRQDTELTEQVLRIRFSLEDTYEE